MPMRSAIGIINSGTGQLNSDINLYSMRNINNTIYKDDAQSPSTATGTFSYREIWATPAKDFKPWLLFTAYPASGNGDAPFDRLMPDYSQLSNAVDGWTAFMIDATDTAFTIVRKDLMWLGIGDRWKFGVNSAGKFGSAGHIGDFSVSQLTTPSPPTVAIQGGGSADTTWGYTIVKNGHAGTTPASSETQVTGNTTLNGTYYNRIRVTTWLPGEVSATVYRKTAGGTPATTGIIGTIYNVPYPPTNYDGIT